MFVSELDSFILKFKQLWKAGHVAHLDVDASAGKAWVGLRVQLGDPHDHQEARTLHLDRGAVPGVLLLVNLPLKNHQIKLLLKKQLRI